MLNSKKFSSIYRGIVEDINDPENLGRCRVRVPVVHGQQSSGSTLPWARPIVTTPVRKGRGSFIIPDEGDIVWVIFEGGEKSSPIYIGGTHAKGELSVDKDTVDFYIEEDMRVSYRRKENKYIIDVGGNHISIDKESVSITDTIIEGNLNVLGNLTVSGTATLGGLLVTGHAHFGGTVSGLPVIEVPDSD